MAIATKPRPSVHHKKRNAEHHRRDKSYLKPYWPYLPMAAIIGAGALINHALYGVSLSSGVPAGGQPPGATRIGFLTGRSEWSVAIAVIAIAAVLIFLGTHWYRLQRMLNRGEAFAVRHPWFDIALVTVFTAGVILTRSA